MLLRDQNNDLKANIAELQLQIRQLRDAQAQNQQKQH
jgi:hypothetical protein